MEKEFITYNLAIKLKELGFEEPCLGIYDGRECKNDGYVNTIYYSNPPYRSAKPSEKNIKYPESYLYKSPILAPLWQQAFYWFREKYRLLNHLTAHLNTWGEDGALETYYGYRIMIDKDGYKCEVWEHISTYDTYEQARNACLEKLIELANKSL